MSAEYSTISGVAADLGHAQKAHLTPAIEHLAAGRHALQQAIRLLHETAGDSHIAAPTLTALQAGCHEADKALTAAEASDTSFAAYRGLLTGTGNAVAAESSVDPYGTATLRTPLTPQARSRAVAIQAAAGA